MNVSIRKSKPNDIFAIQKVKKNTWIDTYPNDKQGITKQDICEVFSEDNTSEGKAKIKKKKEIYKDKNSEIWVAVDHDKIIGFCFAKRNKEDNRIGAIYVLPKFQGNGIGSQLLKKALNWLDKTKGVYVNCATYNNKGIEFYKKHGFEKTGKQDVFDNVARLPCGKIIPETELFKKPTIT